MHISLSTILPSYLQCSPRIYPMKALTNRGEIKDILDKLKEFNETDAISE